MTKLENNWKDKALDNLEKQIWSDELEYPSNLVRKCHELRKIQLRQLSPGDTRLLLGQRIGIKFLVPLAIEILEGNPMIDSDLYEGDLLETVLDMEGKYWLENFELHNRMKNISSQIIPETKRLQQMLTKFRKL